MLPELMDWSGIPIAGTIVSIMFAQYPLGYEYASDGLKPSDASIE